MLSTAQLRVYTVAYWAKEIMWSMAERTCLVHALGNGIRGAFFFVIMLSGSCRLVAQEHDNHNEINMFGKTERMRKNRWTSTPTHRY